MVLKVNNFFIAIALFLLSTQVFAYSMTAKDNVPKGIKLTSGSLAQLESFQKNSKTDPNKPFKLEMICFKQKKKKVMGSNIKCKAERIRFVEPKKK